MRKHLKQNAVVQKPFYRLSIALIFLTAVQTLNARALIQDFNRKSFLGGAGTLDTANEILNHGNKEQDVVDVNSVKIFELFGFKSPEEMALRLREISQHDGILLASSGVTDEALDKVMSLNPEFRERGMRFKETVAKKKDPISIVSVSPFSSAVGTLSSSLAPISSNASNSLLASTSVNEAKVNPCGAGCDGNRARANQAIADFNRINGKTSLANNNLGNSSNRNLGKLTSVKNFYNPITNIASVLGHESSISNLSREPANLSSDSNTVGENRDASGNLVFDPGISISSNNGEFNADSFSVAPEGWFSQEYSPGSGIIIRGALDRKFNKDNLNDPNNFIQVAITKDIRNNSQFKGTPFEQLPPGVYTVKKCEVGCVDHMYDNFAINLDNFNNSILRGDANKNSLSEFQERNKMLPGMVDALAGLQKLLDDAPSKNVRDVVANVQARSRENVSSLQKSTATLKSQGALAAKKVASFGDYMTDIFTNKKYYTLKHDKQYKNIAKEFKNLRKEDIVVGKKTDQGLVTTQKTTDANLP